MSGWQLLEFASGQLWNAPAQSLTFAPRINPQSYQGVFITGAAWGQFTQSLNSGLTAGTATLSVSFGTQSFKSLTLAVGATAAVVTIDGAAVPSTVTTAAGSITINFAAFPGILTGSTLTVTLS
jgi:hypothetical protein